MIYKITWAEVKKTGESNGRKWAITEMNLEDSEGKVTEKVSTFDSVQNGGTIEGTIAQGKYGLEFKKLEAPEFIKNQRGNSNYKSQQIEKMVDKKNESISHFQDKKEESIALAGAQRDAVLIVTTLLANNPKLEEMVDLKVMITEWRNWFLSDSFRLPPPFQE